MSSRVICFYFYLFFLIKFFTVFYPVNKFKRRKCRKDNYIFYQNKVAEYLSTNYIKKYEQGLLKDYQIKPKKDLPDEKIIWQYWGQGSEALPEIVKACFKSVEKNSKDYKIIRLDDKNIEEYINLPDFVFKKLKSNKGFSYALFSDLLRISLLSVYGGIWIDATIFLSDEIPQNLLEKKFFLFQRNEKTDNYIEWENYNRAYFCWDKDFRVRILNSFIIAKKNNKIILALRDILLNYWEKENKILHYFIFQILFDELMKDDKYNSENCEIISDTLPHIMQKNINRKFNADLWKEITEKSVIHKLTYYKKIKENTILDYILKI